MFVPFVYLDGSVFPVFNNYLSSAAQYLVLLVYSYYFPDKIDTAYYTYSIVSAGVPIAKDTFSVCGLRAFC